MLTCASDFLILYSRLNDLSLGFQVPHLSEADAVPVSVPDPFVVHIPRRSPDQDKPNDVRHEAHFLTLLFKEVEQAPSGNKTDFTPSARLAKLFILDASLAVQESLFFAPLDNDGDLQVIDMPLSRDVLRLKKRNAGVRRSIRAGFVVDDFDESTTVTIKSHNLRAAPALLSSTLSWTVDYAAAYLAAIGEKVPSARRSDVKPMYDRGFKDCLENLAKFVLESDNKDSITSQTM